ncbi:hypothetical protein [Phenylobacterium sp. J367]|uniref:hypothetical protein n=1 Tax=Phenylobacterium sp. J367 TaxID=2898435 RepID=UPI00215193EE|nr:hypothetical protein [Phenylobacterium sp. J367]MCR5877287.1 hypothetical protein [Phenylobacterium sp. J367]
MPVTTRMNRRGRRYLDRARAYGRAAGALASVGMVEDARPPFFMLIAHAMELGLKAVIAGGAVDDERLIIIGHDLPLCLRLASDGGLDLEPAGAEIETVLEALAMPHLAQTLRYPAYLSWPLPDPQAALNALEGLLSRVAHLLEAPPRSALN